MDLEISIEGLKSAADRPKLESAMTDVPGIAAVNLAENKLAIRYDPERITAAEISDLVRQAGFQVAAAENAPATPTIEPAGEPGPEGTNRP